MPVITPNRVTPDLGGPYRNRETGQVGELIFYREGFAAVGFGDGPNWFGTTADFWERFIHAEACDESGD